MCAYIHAKVKHAYRHACMQTFSQIHKIHAYIDRYIHIGLHSMYEYMCTYMY